LLSRKTQAKTHLTEEARRYSTSIITDTGSSKLNSLKSLNFTIHISLQNLTDQEISGELIHVTTMDFHSAKIYRQTKQDF